MNEWSRTRKRNALLVAILFLLVVVAVPLYFYFDIKPTCFDTKQNGDESGVDCGGSCTTLCSSQSLPLVVKGDPRVLQVATSTYEVVISVQNPNAAGSILHAGYTIKLYEASSTVPLKIIVNNTYVPKNSTFAIFEGPFSTGDKKPVRATFEWNKSSLNWVRNTNVTPDIFITNDGLRDASTSPRINAHVLNRTLAPLGNIYLVVLVTDSTGTIQAASKTYVEELGPNVSAPVSFTWPQGFAFFPTAIEVVPTVLPDSSYIR